MSYKPAHYSEAFGRAVAYRLIGAVNKATCSTILSRRHRPVVVAEPDTWFPSLRFRSRIRSRIRFRNRFRKIRVRACLTYAVAAGACARQQRGRPRRQAAEFPAQKSGQSSRRVRTAGTEK